MSTEKKIICPMNGKKCIEDGAIVMVDGQPEMHACRFWVHVTGKNPQGGDVDNADCVFCWTPMLLIENSQMQRQTGAAVESFRNEMVRANDSAQQVLLATAGFMDFKAVPMKTINNNFTEDKS